MKCAVLLGGGEAEVHGVQVARVLLAGAPAQPLKDPQKGVPTHRQGRGKGAQLKHNSFSGVHMLYVGMLKSASSAVFST